MASARHLGFAACLCLLAGCGRASTPPEPAAPTPTAAPAHACEDAYEDLTRYFAADPDRPAPAGLNEAAFVGACRELPALAQRCMLFSFMQAHAAACDDALSHAPPDVMRRLAKMAGKKS